MLFNTLRHDAKDLVLMFRGYYENGRIALDLVEVETGELYCEVTVNEPNVEIDQYDIILNTKDNPFLYELLYYADFINADWSNTFVGNTIVGLSYEIITVLSPRLLAFGIPNASDD